MGERIKESTGQYVHDLKEAGGRLWDATQRTVSAAGSKAALYGKVVQRRLDLASLERRIERRREDLGRAVFAAWRDGELDIARRDDLGPILAALDDLDRQREAVAHEIDALRAEPEAASAGGAEGAPPEGEQARKEEAEEELHL